MTHIDLFTGIGGFAYAAQAVWGDEYENVLFCDNNKFCQEVIKKHFGKESIIYEDIREITLERIITHSEFNGHTERHTKTGGKIGQSKEGGVLKPSRKDWSCDLLTGGFPCQPFSQAGKRGGVSDNRYLWPEMFRVIQITKPTWIIAENVRGLLTISGGLVFEQVCGDLETYGYDVQPVIIPACAVNAPHRRDRVWIIACNTHGDRFTGQEGRHSNDTHANAMRLQGQRPKQQAGRNRPDIENVDNTQREGLQGLRDKKRTTEQAGTQQADMWTADWSANWLEVATSLCGMDARFSDWMDGYFREIIAGGFNEDNTRKEMRILFKAIQSKEIREKIGGLYKVDETEILLETVCQLQKRIGKSQRLHMESQEISKGKMRILPQYETIRRSSCGREHCQQLAEKFTHIVQGVSYETALEIVETGLVLWGAYKAIQGREVNLDGFKLTKAGHRVERLKSLGNAIVPQVAIEIMKAIKYSMTA